MKKVITALLNENVNEKLQQYEEINVFVKDIQYQEGILEVLQIQKEIDFIILSEFLPGQYNIKQLIEEIKKLKNDIKIILILEKENKELENFLLSKGNIFIYYNNKIEIKDIAEKIIQKKQKEDLEKEIEEIKKLICEKEQKDNEEKNRHKK